MNGLQKQLTGRKHAVHGLTSNSRGRGYLRDARVSCSALLDASDSGLDDAGGVGFPGRLSLIRSAFFSRHLRHLSHPPNVLWQPAVTFPRSTADANYLPSSGASTGLLLHHDASRGTSINSNRNPRDIAGSIRK